ncbi:MAG: PLDc N-terminal domain-containing protein [Methanosarcinaceae archaeon]|nr:PLDc N-terminal domain-containing protein [Methanosarcinaceae archaeon]
MISYLLIFLEIGVLCMLFWFWMLIDCLIYEQVEGNERFTWFLIILFTPLIGAITYYIVKRPKRLAGVV